jgi:hypothetical protein
MAAGPAMSPHDYERWREEHTWAPSRASGLVIQGDLAPAAWIEPLLVPDSWQVQMMVPRRFEAYARVFFPFPGADIVAEGKVIDQELITWTEMALRNGRTAHALMEAETILAGPDGHEYPGAGSGSLAGMQSGALLAILARHTSSPDSWFLLWDGFGNLNEQAFSHHDPKVRHPLRNYYLLHGPHHSYAGFPDDPNYWWPEDRAWCVVTDTDFDWAYVSGTAACIEEILADPAIDAYPTRPENPAHSGMDVLNDPDATIPRMP